MIYQAHWSDTHKFLQLPETGMGYQVIDAKLIGRNYTDKYIVYNAQLIVEVNDSFSESLGRIRQLGFSRVLNEAQILNLSTDSIRLLSKKEIFSSHYHNSEKGKKYRRHSGGKGAIDNEKEFANGEEKFVRLSAYENDKRIDLTNNRLLPGSYTTTHPDYFSCVATKDDPVDRYALPNNEEIKWAFFVQPQKRDILQRGIVQPAFGQDGGGIEAYFENGTSNNTFWQKRLYGK